MKFNGWITELGAKDENNFFHRNSYYRRDNNFGDNKQRFIKRYKNTDIYQCAYHYESSDYNACAIIGEPYLDFDIDDIEQNYKRLVRAVKYAVNYIEIAMGIPPEELKIYFSGSKGFHVVIPGEIIGVMPSQNLNEEFKNFAMGMAYLSSGRKKEKIPEGIIDLKIYDRKRLFRMVNSINSKSGLYKVPVSIDQLYDFSYSDMREWASRPRFYHPRPPVFRAKAVTGYVGIIETALRCQGMAKKKNNKKVQLKEGERLKLLPCTQDLLKTGAIKGSRNISCFALASSLLQSGYTSEEVFDMVEDWNSRNEEPLEDKEIEVTVSSAINSYESGMTVGCAKYKDLGYCQSDCKLME